MRGLTRNASLAPGHIASTPVRDPALRSRRHTLHRQALHARSLALRHPLTGEALEFVAPLHDDFKAALRQLGLVLPDGGE